MGLQILLDLAYSIPLHIEVKYQPDGLSLIWNNLQYAIRTFGVAEESGVVEERLATPHTVADAKLDILTTLLALRLIQSGQLVDDTVTGGQSVDASVFNVNSNIHFL